MTKLYISYMILILQLHQILVICININSVLFLEKKKLLHITTYMKTVLANLY
nr:MAG TPA: hypothetical protein [Caudoviricetes sp.]